MEFDCGTQEQEFDLSEEGVSAVATDETSTSGEFIDSSSGVLWITTFLSCDGDGCDDLGVGGNEQGEGSVSMPCETSSQAEIKKL